MPPAFLDEDFLLGTPQARELYHGRAAGLPVIDFHSHLPAGEIAADRRWSDLAEAWLSGDHYKWRLMRWAGAEERLCTGGAPGREKFEAFAAALPRALRSPLYHWSHLELKRHFGISGLLLGPSTAGEVWERAGRALAEPGFSARGLLRAARAEAVCTTDDPADGLEAHAACAADPSLGVQVRPTWRPDRAWAAGDPAAYGAWLDRLGARAGVSVSRLGDLLEALARRHAAFHEGGARLSDRGLAFLPPPDAPLSAAEEAFDRARSGRAPSPEGLLALQSVLLRELAALDASRGWVMQLHLGPLRDARTRLREAAGADAGADAIGDHPQAEALARHLDALERAGALPKTILYNSNPRDNELFAALAGCFQGGTPGRVQWGSAWWFMDQLDGMRRQIETLSQLGALGVFVGMVTDGRSFLSFPRHEYFRRLLCSMLGEDMAAGRLPGDMKLVGGLVEDVCYRNARGYFGFFPEPAGGEAERGMP